MCVCTFKFIYVYTCICICICVYIYMQIFRSSTAFISHFRGYLGSSTPKSRAVLSIGLRTVAEPGTPRVGGPARRSRVKERSFFFCLSVKGAWHQQYDRVAVQGGHTNFWWVSRGTCRLQKGGPQLRRDLRVEEETAGGTKAAGGVRRCSESGRSAQAARVDSTWQGRARTDGLPEKSGTAAYAGWGRQDHQPLLLPGQA